jgi:SpoVK/Ycf46/Vps4 family AAA+-type ATPase
LVARRNDSCTTCKTKGLLITSVQVVARENDCHFIHISPEILRYKEYGYTEKAVAALFSLSQKLWRETRRPTILFLDEVDTILGDKSEHEAYRAAKTIFAQKWDGIERQPGTIVLGATNHEEDLPAFIYRRFSTRFRVRHY